MGPAIVVVFPLSNSCNGSFRLLGSGMRECGSSSCVFIFTIWLSSNALLYCIVLMSSRLIENSISFHFHNAGTDKGKSSHTSK